MLASIKNIFKWNPRKPSETRKNHTSLLLAAFIGILEDILFWKKMWLSLSFIFFLNLVFFVCIHRQVNFVEFILGLSIIAVTIDAFEAWLKYKHRTGCLKRIAAYEGHKLNTVAVEFNQWVGKRWNNFLYLRETNHTKAFLLINIYLGMAFVAGKYMNGYLLIYLLLMYMCLFYKVILPLLTFFRNMRHDLESDYEFEGLIPEVSEGDIKLLSIEPEHNNIADDRQIYDYWKPEDVPLADCSDSSDNSSSIVTNFSMEKMRTLEKDVESSDTSEDEYIPLDQQKEQLQSTLEVVEPSQSWGSAAYNALWNITGAVTNMMQTESRYNKRQRLSSIDSSDGFEIVDKNEVS